MAAHTEAATYRNDTAALEQRSLLKLTEHAHLILTGTVRHTNYIYRQGVRPDGGAAATTDIIVRVATMIKGEPNFGENHVKFMIEGGEFYSARKGKMMRSRSTNQPEFEVGEQVLLFLTIPESANSYHVNYAHGGLHVHRFVRGKKPIVDDSIQVTYVKAENEGITVQLPIDLAVNLTKHISKTLMQPRH